MNETTNRPESGFPPPPAGPVAQTDPISGRRPPARNPVRGFLFALAGTAVVSTNFVTAKYGVKGFNPESFSLVWTACGAIYALGIVAATGKTRELRLPSGSVLPAIALGAFTAAGMILSWAGLSLLDPSFQAFLFRFMPVLMILMGALFLSERMRAVELVPMALMILGGVWSTLGRWDVVGTGVVLSILACFAGAGQMLIAKILVRKIHPTALVFHRLALGTVFIAGWVLITGKGEFSAAPGFWAATAVGAFLGPCFSHVLTFRSYRYWELGRSAMVSAVQPLFVLPLALVFLKKFPERSELFGGAVILAGGVLLAWLQLGAEKKVTRPATKAVAEEMS